MFGFKFLSETCVDDAAVFSIRAPKQHTELDAARFLCVLQRLETLSGAKRRGDPCRLVDGTLSALFVLALQENETIVTASQRAMQCFGAACADVERTLVALGTD